MEVCWDFQLLEIIRGECGQELVHEEFIQIVEFGVDFFRLIEIIGVFQRGKTIVMVTTLVWKKICISIFFFLEAIVLFVFLNL